MPYQCKIYDEHGKLKKTVQGNEALSKTSKSFLEQKSTKKAAAFIKKLKDQPIEKQNGTKFYNNNCMVCGREFHPRHPQTKYCSHECQKALYLKKKKLKSGVTLKKEKN